MSTDRVTIANLLEQVGAFLEFRDENPFRVRAFRNAAKAVLSLPGSVAGALADGSLAATKGIGPATLNIVKELLDTGRSSYLEELRREVPAGLVDLLAIPGLGAARIRVLHKELGIDSVAALEAAARDGRLASLHGFGEKIAKKLLKGIEFARGTQAFRLHHRALAEAEALRAALAGLPGISSALIAGEVRLGREVVSELALVAVSDAAAAELGRAITALPGVGDLQVQEEGVLRFQLAGGLPASVWVTPQSQLGAALVRATGSASHFAALEARARERGVTLAGGMLRRDGVLVPTPDEASCYDLLDLAEIPPELREGFDEVALAARRALPRLIEPADLAGILHCHSTYSDGALSLEELALACRDAGYAYLGVTDHSRSAAYAGGLSVDEVRRQWEEIDRLNATRPGIRVLKGIESDILPDGSLDYEDSVLAGFDFVIGSIHSRMALGEAENTTRILRALEHPSLAILGHPTGRVLLERNPYPLDLERIFESAASRGVAIEINGHPHRLDLDWRLVRRARERGVMLSLGADAHGRAELANQGFAVRVARKGGLEKHQVLNTRTVEEFLAFAQARRAA